MVIFLVASLCFQRRHNLNTLLLHFIVHSKGWTLPTRCRFFLWFCPNVAVLYLLPSEQKKCTISFTLDWENWISAFLFRTDLRYFVRVMHISYTMMVIWSVMSSILTILREKKTQLPLQFGVAWTTNNSQHIVMQKQKNQHPVDLNLSKQFVLCKYFVPTGRRQIKDQTNLFIQLNLNWERNHNKSGEEK